jgi:hypothetical protein
MLTYEALRQRVASLERSIRDATDQERRPFAMAAVSDASGADTREG